MSPSAGRDPAPDTPQGYGQIFVVDVPEFDSLPDWGEVARNRGA